jgi:hypothetical protein
VTFYLPDDAVAGFIISNITAVLAGAVISMNRYAIRHSKGLKGSILSLFSGSSISVLSRHLCKLFFAWISPYIGFWWIRNHSINIFD